MKGCYCHKRVLRRPHADSDYMEAAQLAIGPASGEAGKRPKGCKPGSWPRRGHGSNRFFGRKSGVLRASSRSSLDLAAKIALVDSLCKRRLAHTSKEKQQPYKVAGAFAKSTRQTLCPTKLALSSCAIATWPRARQLEHKIRFSLAGMRSQ